MVKAKEKAEQESHPVRGAWIEIVKALDSNWHYKFAKGTSITKVKLIMGNGTNKPLNNKYAIALRHNVPNPDSIQKLRGEGFVMVNG